MIKSPIEQDQFDYYSQWWHAVIREMVALKEFCSDPKWIAAQVWPRISVKDAEESMNLLQKLNIIYLDEEDETWKQTNTTVTTGGQVLSFSVANYHNASIAQGLEALASIKQENRHISSLTLCKREPVSKN